MAFRTEDSWPPGVAPLRHWQEVRLAAPGIGETLRRSLAAFGSRMLAATGLRLDSKRAEIPALAVLPVADASFALSAIDDPAWPFASEMHKVHDELLASHTAAGNPSVLIVAADADEEDTATVALALAALVAATRRVLLIDADLECRTLAAIDAETADAGLVDVAVGRRLLCDAMSCDRDTGINLMALIGSHSRRGRRIRDDDVARAFALTKRYGLVIVAAMDQDDPSVGFFGALVDHILIVAGAEAYDAAAASRWLAGLGFDAAKIRGAILTGAM